MIYISEGTGRSDFGHQIQGQNALDLKKYTLICIEPLGWGRSRPPVRKYDAEIYNKDAYCCYELMEVWVNYFFIQNIQKNSTQIEKWT